VEHVVVYFVADGGIAPDDVGKAGRAYLSQLLTLQAALVPETIAVAQRFELVLE
jgi:hypothetical protein